MVTFRRGQCILQSLASRSLPESTILHLKPLESNGAQGEKREPQKTSLPGETNNNSTLNSVTSTTINVEVDSGQCVPILTAFLTQTLTLSFCLGSLLLQCHRVGTLYKAKK